MSNEYKDWTEDLKNSPIGSEDHKRWLLMEYPWLNMSESEAIYYLDNTDEVYTYIDCAPEGWAKLCEDLCAELKAFLDRNNIKDYSICQVKEKYGELRWYDNGVPEEHLDEYRAIIRKYTELSYNTCVDCGAPATKVSRGYILPFCDKCAEKVGGKFEDIT